MVASTRKRGRRQNPPSSSLDDEIDKSTETVGTVDDDRISNREQDFVMILPSSRFQASSSSINSVILLLLAMGLVLSQTLLPALVWLLHELVISSSFSPQLIQTTNYVKELVEYWVYDVMPLLVSSLVTAFISICMAYVAIQLQKEATKHE